jgi:hypothetical protein
MGLELFSDHSLTRARVSVPTRIMMPGYLLHSTWFAIVYTLDPQDRLHRAPGLAAVRYIGVPFEVWGSLLGVIALMLAAALLWHLRQLAIFALYCYVAMLGWWALIYVTSAFLDPATSFGAGAWAILTAVACIATARSLSRGDT